MEQNLDIDKIAAELAGGMSLEQLRQKQGGNPYEKRFEPSPTVPQTEEAREYMRKLWMERGKEIRPKIHRQLEQELSYEEARVKFWRIMEERAFEISGIENRDFSWDISNEMAARIKNLIKYFINDPESEYKLNKGLFFCGPTGTGKSEFIKMFERFCSECMLSKEFKVSSLSTIHTRAKSDKDFDPVMPYIQFNRCFDEFGRHIGPVVRFGDTLNITEAIIEERYERHNRYGQFTHLVANMTPNEVKEVFPPMIFDRIRAMCTSVVFGGQSKRV